MAKSKAPKRRRLHEDRPPVPEGWEPRAHNAKELEELVSRLPNDPGVYIMRDRKGEVVYVGKARRLKVRVKQYFSGQDTRFFVPHLEHIVGDIETMVTNGDKESLLLENHLIKTHRPRFNFKLRDDKQYLVIRLDPSKAWPKLELVRDIQPDGAKYFGPYHTARSARQTLRVVNRHFQLRTCTDFVLNSRKRPCLQYQIGRCPAPCVYDVDEGAYGEQVEAVSMFLGGRHQDLIAGMEAKMKAAADDLEFEVAARVRDQLKAVKAALESQRIVAGAKGNQDAVGLYREGGQVELVVLQVRNGKLMGSQSFSEKGMEVSDEELLAQFIAAYYEASPMIPDEVLSPRKLVADDAEPLEEWLRDKRGKKVGLLAPERGAKKSLVALANKNAASNFATRRNQREDSEAAMQRLQERLHLTKLPRRIECYDVSHIQGSDPVASMVVFVDGKPEKKSYRSFKIRGTSGDAQTNRQNDDFASMYEVLGRRLRRAVYKNKGTEEDDAWALPDLMVIDGGKGQLGRVIAAMEDLGISVGAEGVDVVSLAKERPAGFGMNKKALSALARYKEEQGDSATDGPGATLQDYAVSGRDQNGSKKRGKKTAARPERVFVPDSRDPITLRSGSSELYLMTQIRDEAHRFAITYHRKRRSKRQIKSKLDGISGVGPATKKALIAHFGSVSAVTSATADELEKVKGVGPSLAKTIADHFSG